MIRFFGFLFSALSIAAIAGIASRPSQPTAIIVV